MAATEQFQGHTSELRAREHKTGYLIIIKMASVKNK